jgi:hypothetical protein
VKNGIGSVNTFSLNFRLKTPCQWRCKGELRLDCPMVSDREVKRLRENKAFLGSKQGRLRLRALSGKKGNVAKARRI